MLIWCLHNIERAPTGRIEQRGNAMRVVSLLPAATEIVAALGLAECLVGVSHECDYPPEVA